MKKGDIVTLTQDIKLHGTMIKDDCLENIQINGKKGDKFKVGWALEDVVYLEKLSYLFPMVPKEVLKKE